MPTRHILLFLTLSSLEGATRIARLSSPVQQVSSRHRGMDVSALSAYEPYGQVRPTPTHPYIPRFRLFTFAMPAVRLYALMEREDDPKKCTAAKLVRFGKVREVAGASKIP